MFLIFALNVTNVKGKLIGKIKACVSRNGHLTVFHLFAFFVWRDCYIQKCKYIIILLIFKVYVFLIQRFALKGSGVVILFFQIFISREYICIITILDMNKCKRKRYLWMKSLTEPCFLATGICPLKLQVFILHTSFGCIGSMVFKYLKFS